MCGRAADAPVSARSYLLLVNPQVLAKAGMNPEDVVTAMCLSCGIPTVVSGLLGNLPFVMAPGLGLSAYLTYGLVGDGSMTWQEAMGCILIAGLIMAVLTVTDLVTKSMKHVPQRRRLYTIEEIDTLCEAAIRTARFGQQLADYVRLMAFCGVGAKRLFTSAGPTSIGNRSN